MEFKFLQFFKGKSKTAFAIDIGSHFTKIMDVLISGNEMSIQKFSVRRTPSECFDSGEVLDQTKLSQFILQFLIDLNIDKTSVITGVTGKGFMTKKIDIPKIEDHLIGEHLPFEAEQYLPYEISQVDLDYEILKDFNSDGKDQLPVLLIAVLKKTVEQYNALFEEARLDCSILDANAFAMANSFEFNNELAEDENVLLIDIGASNTNLLTISNKQILFTRNMKLGGRLYTQKICEQMKMDFEEAEELKVHASKGGSGESPEELLSLFTNYNHFFCDEIYTGYESYLNFFQDYKISRIFVTGGGSQVPQLLSALEDKFSLPVGKMNLLEKVNVATDSEVETKDWEVFSAVCMGLALRNIG